MKLIDIIDNSRTDKNTIHSYLPLYQELLEHKKESAKNVLEIGIYYGGSIKLWSDYFTNATVHGLDIMNIIDISEDLKNNPNIVVHSSINAYDESFFNNTMVESNIKFDILVDDGPHTLESMIFFTKMYSSLMTEDGILIIEDIQDWGWINILIEETPEHLKPFIKVHDLRSVKGRYDDIVFTINKSQPN